MISLIDAYLQEKNSWWIESPKSAKESSLLLLQAGLSEVQAYQRMGWNVRSVVFAPGLASALSKEDPVHLVSIWDESWPIDGFHFDQIQCNQGFESIARSDRGLLRKCLSYLHPHGELKAQIKNPQYFATILAKASRELFPFPSQAPVSSGSGLEDIKTRLIAQGYKMIETQDVIDPAFNNPDSLRWSALDEWDCQLNLPQDPDQRRLLFTRSWRLRSMSAEESNASTTLTVDDLFSVHQEVQSLLESARLDEAGLILDKIFALGQGNAFSYNLQGILYFYRNDSQKAWESFLMALTLEPNVDHGQNLIDAAKKNGQIAKTRDILNRLAIVHPELSRLEI